MYGKVREVGYNDLLAKKQLDDASHAKLGEVGTLLNQFRPSETFNTYLQDKTAVVNRNRLHDDYQNIAIDLANKQEELVNKHANNLSTPEAQKDFNDYQNYVNRAVGQLKSIKESEDTLKKSQDELAKQLAEGDVGNIDGSLSQANRDFLSHYSTNSQMSNLYNKNLITGTKIIDNSKKIKDYIGDNMTFIRKDDVLGKLGIRTVDDILPVLQDSKTSYETKQRLSSHLQSLANNYITENQGAVANHAKQIMYDQSVINPDKPISQEEAYKQAEQQVRNRFNQFIIDDRKIGRDLNTKLLSDEQAKGSGKGVYSPTRDISIIENPLMDSNVKPEVFDLDDKGNLKTEYTTTKMRTVKDEFGVRDKVPTKITRTLTASTPQEYSKLLYDNEAFRNVLNAEGVNIVGDVKSTDIPKIQKALKDNKERVYNNLQLATNGYDAVQLNVPKLDQTMSNQINATTLRFNKDQTLPKDLPQKDTKTGSMDGSTFNDWLAGKYNVKIQTDNILAATGQLGKPVGLKRTVIYQDEKGGPSKKLDIYQDSPFKDINDNPDYNALNEITKYTSSGKDASQVKVPTNKGDYIFELKRTPNNQTKTYDYSGKVYDPITRTWSSYEDFKKASTVGILLDVLKNSEGVGRSFTKDDIGQVENMYNNSNNLTSEEE